MTFLSLFAGIGGFDLGLERAGWTCVGQVEVDPYGRSILERHWPNVRRRGDVRLVDDELAREWWSGIDAIVGGFPCQDVSCAGKGAGVEKGARSGLWREFARLIRCLRPRWVVAENVPALRTRGADLVIGDMEAAGYTVWPCVVGADDLGAPHRRKRVWLIARLADPIGSRRDGGASESERGAESRVTAERAGGGVGDPNSPRCEGAGTDAHEGRPGSGDGCARLADAASVGSHGAGRSFAEAWDGGEDSKSGGSHGLADADGHGVRLESGRGGGATGAGAAVAGTAHRWPARPGEPQHEWEAPRTTEPSVGRPTNGLSRRLALKAYGNAVVPQIPELIGRAILAVDR